MSYISIKQCPYCGTKNSSGFVAHSIETNKKQNDLIGRYCPDNHRFHTYLVVCSSCGSGLTALISLPSYENSKSSEALIALEDASFFPKLDKSDIPSNLPTDVLELYEEALFALENRKANSAVMMFRKTLEKALSIKYPMSEKNLSKVINKLNEEKVIPKSLSEWAHECRVIGNDGAHNDVNMNDARSIADLTYFILSYIISIPAQIELLHPKTSAE